jgi:trigger factor
LLLHCSLQKAYADALRDLSKKQKIPGFSTGNKVQKVPDSVIINYYGEELVKGHALEMLTESAIKRAIDDAGIKAIGQAELVQDAQSLVACLTPGEPLHIDVRVDVWPQVKFTGEYTGYV